MFLDSDDTLEKHAVSDMYKIIVDENSDAVYPNTYIKVFEKDASRVQATHFTNEMFSRDPKIFALDILIGKGRARRSTAVLYDLDVIRKNSIRYLNGRISEDFFFNLDYLSAASAISLYDKPSLNNLKREGSISSSYFESFFDTILEMDKCVDKFICSIDSNLYKANISGKRDSLLFRNLMIYVINVMGDKSTSYNKRVQKCIAMMKHQRFQEALSSRIEIPYFEGKIKRYYMKVLLQLVNIKMYHAGCMMAWIAAKLNTL